MRKRWRGNERDREMVKEKWRECVGVWPNKSIDRRNIAIDNGLIKKEREIDEKLSEEIYIYIY